MFTMIDVVGFAVFTVVCVGFVWMLKKGFKL